ncbi:MAG: PaaI family thioesterase [Pseudomonadota bacterium]
MADNAEKPIVFSSMHGLQQTLGYEAEVYSTHADVHLTIEQSHLNSQGHMHGGIFCVILDSACGFAASRALSDDASQRVVTVSLTTNYLAPGQPGAIVARGEVVRVGNKTVFCEGKVYDSAGMILATATGVFKKSVKSAK